MKRRGDICNSNFRGNDLGYLFCRSKDSGNDFSQGTSYKFGIEVRLVIEIVIMVQ